MSIVLVCGPTGVGKTSYSVKFAKEVGAVRFSIDPWMQNLFSKDMKELDYTWMIERVERCYKQIWEVAEQIVVLGGTVVLDLGFTTKEQRSVFVDLAKGVGVSAEIHYLNASSEIRRSRVKKRNQEKDPDVYAFEVTDFMFDFMEPRFEVPDEEELSNGKKIINE